MKNMQWISRGYKHTETTEKKKKSKNGGGIKKKYVQNDL
jgi:hypothetical protein